MVHNAGSGLRYTPGSAKHCTEFKHGAQSRRWTKVLTWLAASNRRSAQSNFGGVLSHRSDYVLEDAIACRDLDGLAVHAALQELLGHIRGKTPLPEDDTCSEHDIRQEVCGKLNQECVHKGQNCKLVTTAGGICK